MSDPRDPHRLALPVPAPDDDVQDWDDSDGPLVIEDEAPPITHWDLLSEERIPAVSSPESGERRAPRQEPLRPLPLTPRLPRTGSVLPENRPSLAALPVRPPDEEEPIEDEEEPVEDEEEPVEDEEEPVEDEFPHPDSALLDVPDAESLGSIAAIAFAEDEPEDEPEDEVVEEAEEGDEEPEDEASEEPEDEASEEPEDEAGEEPEEPEDEAVEEPEREEVAAAPSAAAGAPEADALERLLAAPSAESMARMPALALPDPPSEKPQAVEIVAADPTPPPATPDDSLRAWAKRTSPEPGGPATAPVKSPRRKGPAVQFAEMPQPTGPAITFAEEPEPEALPASTPANPLPDRISDLVGRSVDLVVDPPAPPDGPAPIPLPARYRWLANLGEGGQGRVELVFDRDLGRQVALKTLHAKKDQERHLLEFYAEARITGQLEHPNIMPVYDAGQLPDGRLYYTMRRMPGENLHNVLSKLRRGDPATLRRWTLPDLVRVLEQACHGVGYAHDHNVLHRDLKPANILLGTHGEVLVVDWGIARFVLADDGEVTDSVRRRLWSESRDARRERVRGSPPYMAPEQVKHPDQVGAGADVFCLGVVLYEILTRFPPFQGKEVEEVVEALCHERPVPPRERAPDLQIPAELEEICLRCLEKFPGHRYPSATKLAEALAAWQSGARRREAASRRLREADGMRTRYQTLMGQKRGALTQLLAARGPVGSLRGASEGAPQVRALDERVRSLERAADGVFSEAVWALHRALSDDPENPVAQARLAELYSDRFAEAERLGLDRERAYFRALLRQFDDGRWGRWLRGGGELTLEVRPPEAALSLRRLDDVDGRYEPGEEVEPREPGQWSVAPGRYAVVPASGDWHYPVLLRRNQRVRLVLDLRDEEHAGERFSFVPGGLALLGGDPLAPGSGPEREVDIPRFAIARHPVSVGAYARFLAWLQRADSAEARARTPDDWSRQSRGGETRPVVGLSLADARRYCRWLTELTGVTIRLPSADEWEKALRGPDGRHWPWGDRFVPNAAATLHACDPSQPLPSPGAFPLDRSPFGVEDGAGLVWEWTDTVQDDQGVLRGGSVLDDEFGARVAGRRSLPPTRRSPWVSFRVLRQLDD